MEITISHKSCTVEHDGLAVNENSLEQAVQSYGEGMYERGLVEARKMNKEGVDF